jgi:hypothetical protein
VNLKLKAYIDLIEVSCKYKLDTCYLTVAICFRGRFYINGLISPSGDKVFRSYIRQDDTETVQLDATASMLQILAVITSSERLARVTNLITEKQVDTWSTFHDVIKNSSDDELNTMIDLYYSKRKSDKFYISEIKSTIHILDRNIVKMSIMRILYGSNPFKISQDFRREYNLPKLSYKHITLVFAVFEFKYDVEIQALKTIRLLNHGHIRKNNKGLVINNGFIEFSSTYYKTYKEVITFKDRNNKSRSASVDLLCKPIKVDTRKSNTSSLPNLFHSIDSSICGNIIKKFTKNKLFIVPVHDAFTVQNKDRSTLVKTYNEMLFNHSNYMHDLIVANKDKIKITKREKIELDDYVVKLNTNKLNFMRYKSNILNSQFSLKQEVSHSKDGNLTVRKFSSVGSYYKHDNHTDNHTDKNEILKYTINMPDNVNSVEYCHMLVNLLENSEKVSFMKGNIQLYSHHIALHGSYTNKVSTRIHPISNMRGCVDEFDSKFEQYGDHDDHVSIMKHIRFSRLNNNTLSLIKSVEYKLDQHLLLNPSTTDNEM